MSEEEKSRIREQHSKATKAFFDKINENKKGLQSKKQVEPAKPVETKKNPVKPVTKKK
jgi:hypothetical protein